MNDPFSNLNFGKSMGRIFFSQMLIFAKSFAKNLQNFRKFNTNFAKYSHNRGKFLIYWYGSNFWSKFGKCMVQFSFSPWHIPTQTNLSTHPWVCGCCLLVEVKISFLLYLALLVISSKMTIKYRHLYYFNVNKM